MSKTRKITIAVDLMGGDRAPRCTCEGLNAFVPQDYNVNFLLFGDEDQCRHILSKEVLERSMFTDTKVEVETEDSVSVAVRKRESSMKLAIDSVKEKQADAVISAGNTGALMAISKLSLRPMAGIERPAICSTFPTIKGSCVFLDLGANVDCTPENLFQFAIMGNAFAKIVLKKTNPKIAILNIGNEETKGKEILHAASELIKGSSLAKNFVGYVEGDGISQGAADVIVTDGFSGNIALKTAEGAGKLVKNMFKECFNSNIFARIGMTIAGIALKTFLARIDSRNYNGAMFLGLNGICVKSHGGTDSVGFLNALAKTTELARQDINNQIIEQLR